MHMVRYLGIYVVHAADDPDSYALECYAGWPAQKAPAAGPGDNGYTAIY